MKKINIFIAALLMMAFISGCATTDRASNNNYSEAHHKFPRYGKNPF